ncbi:hypothetical protein NKH77_29725 [Streptomyces sp. M19]
MTTALLERSLRWYERELGWPTTGGEPVQLLTGFASMCWNCPWTPGSRCCGAAADRSCGGGGARMRLLVAAGSSEELPGLLDWLEWRGIALDLTTYGAGPDNRPGACFPGHFLDVPVALGDGARRRPPSGCGLPSRGARWNRRCPRQASGRWGAPNSYGS